jgi:hypothetical protein
MIKPMKKLIAVSLLALHLFSLYGYMALYSYAVYHSDKKFNEQISMNKYSLDDLVSVKVPVNMPSVQNWDDYQYISGQVKFKNNSYNYVKMKLTRDTVYLMCIPNYKKTKLLEQNIIDARKIADIPFSKKEHVPFFKAPTLSDFNHQIILYRFISPIAILKKPVNNTRFDLLISNLASPGKPPESPAHSC